LDKIGLNIYDDLTRSSQDCGSEKVSSFLKLIFTIYVKSIYLHFALMPNPM